MDYEPVFGWYYRSAASRSPSWSGVRYLYDFLTGNAEGPGPFGRAVVQEQLLPGDVVQLGHGGRRVLSHAARHRRRPGGRLVAAHSDDALDRRCAAMTTASCAPFHIEGFRAPSPPPAAGL